MTIIDTLVIDRNATDVAFAKVNRDNVLYNKGAYNVSDLNRVESATQYLYGHLFGAGYGVYLSFKTSWTELDNITQQDIDRIRANVDYLQNNFMMIPEWREIVYNNTMDFEQANALEWDLQHIDVWTTSMIAGLDRYSGTFYAGEEIAL
jgi:hypothetical protein